jgi:hypothetical protein
MPLALFQETVHGIGGPQMIAIAMIVVVILAIVWGISFAVGPEQARQEALLSKMQPGIETA